MSCEPNQYVTLPVGVQRGQPVHILVVIDVCTRRIIGVCIRGQVGRRGSVRITIHLSAFTDGSQIFGFS